MSIKKDGRSIRGAGIRIRSEAAMISALTKMVSSGETVLARTVAEESGLTASSVYNHYPTVQDLFDAAAASFLDSIFSQYPKDSEAAALEQLISVSAANSENMQHVVAALSYPKRMGTQLSVKIQEYFGSDAKSALRKARVTTALIVERSIERKQAQVQLDLTSKEVT